MAHLESEAKGLDFALAEFARQRSADAILLRESLSYMLSFQYDAGNAYEIDCLLLGAGVPMTDAGLPDLKQVQDLDLARLVRSFCAFLTPDRLGDRGEQVAASTEPIVTKAQPVSAAKPEQVAPEPEPVKGSELEPLPFTVAQAPISAKPDALTKKARDENQPTQKERCLELWQAGTKEVDAIVAATGFNKGSVQACLSVLRKEGKLPEERKAVILAAYRAGTTSADAIHDETNLPLSCVKQYLFQLRQEGSISEPGPELSVDVPALESSVSSPMPTSPPSPAPFAGPKAQIAQAWYDGLRTTAEIAAAAEDQSDLAASISSTACIRERLLPHQKW